MDLEDRAAFTNRIEELNNAWLQMKLAHEVFTLPQQTNMELTRRYSEIEDSLERYRKAAREMLNISSDYGNNMPQCNP